MAPKKLFPPSLEDSCLAQALILVKNIARNHSQTAEIQEDKLTEDLKMLMEFVSPPVHDKFANLHLRGVKEVFGNEDDRKDGYSKDAHGGGYNSFYQGEAYFNCLMSIIGLLKIKTMCLNDWPKYIQDKLAVFLDKMTWLQGFSCLYLESIDDKILSNACRQFTNLSSFSLSDECTDEILSTLCINCEKLQIINVKFSKAVTDACVSNLVACENVQKINLSGTTVSSEGYFRLLNDSKSTFLYKLDGLGSSLDKVLDEMELSKPSHRFKLKYLHCDNLGEKHLRLAVKYFPFLTKVFVRFSDSRLFLKLMCGTQNMPSISYDLSILSQLELLKEIKLLFWFSSSDDIYEALSSAPFVTSIEFSEYAKSETGPLLTIVSELCPLIEKLCILEDEDDDSRSGNTLRMPSWTNSFERLTKLIWACPTLEYVLDILHNAPNVETIKFAKCSKPALFDLVFEYISNHNLFDQLKELEINCPNNTLSRDMMKRMIVNCQQLTAFKIHSPTLHKNPSELRDFIVQNNYDVDFVALDESRDE